MSSNKENGNEKDNSSEIKVNKTLTRKRYDVCNVNGWGFKDSYFTTKDGVLTFTGNRYQLCGKPLKNAPELFKRMFNIDMKDYKGPYVNPVHKESDYPPAVKNEVLCKELTDAGIDISTEFDDRFLRCRGQGAKDFYILRYGKFKRIPDLVIWPRSHEEVEVIVKLANKHYAVIIPCGGSTNTMYSLNYTKEDYSRLFISLDMTQMNRILWIDRPSMLVCVEAGIVGKDMEDALQREGFTVGHEPDSIEMSTVGGWVATRSAGMKQQTYGNIEDIVIRVTMVTSIGTLEKQFVAPRASVGPDLNHIALGSEGIMGVVTKIVLKLRPKPEVRRFGSFMFRDFDTGVKFMHDASKLSDRPSSLRLVDSKHAGFGIALEFSNNIFESAISSILKFGFFSLFRVDRDKFCSVNYLIESNKAKADVIEKNLKKLNSKHGGFNGGAKFAERGYELTNTNCYTRDLLFDLGFVCDSLETGVTWSRCMPLINAIKETWNIEVKKRNFTVQTLMFRISQIYENGVCVYFYYGIGRTKDKDQFETYEELTQIMRKTIKKAGGSVSHHHGIGKKNIKWYADAISDTGVEVMKSIKTRIDPINVFDVGNLIDISADSDKIESKL